MNKKKVFMILICGVLLMSIGLTKIKCEEKIKGGGEKYMECEGGSVIEQVFGTEYVQNQNGTIFIQVLDNDGEVFNQSLLCQLEIWNPNKTKIINNAMTSLGEDGLFYYDVNPIFNDTGVYMMSSTCFVPVTANQSTEYFRNGVIHHLNKSQGNSAEIMLYTAVTTDEFVCKPVGLKFYEVNNSFDPFEYIDTVNFTEYWSKTGGGTANIDILTRLFILDLTTLDHTLIGSALTQNFEVVASARRVNQTIRPQRFIHTEHEVLAVDLCVKRTTGASVNLEFHYNGNSSMTNSSLTKYTLEKNVSIGYQEIKGSGEIHVSALAPSEVFLGSQENQNNLWIVLIFIIVIIIIVGLWYYA